MTRVRSVHGGWIRLTDERWAHIAHEHGEMAPFREQVLRTVTNPERILAGADEARLAVRKVEDGKWLVVVYREHQGDGFIITACMTRRERALDRRRKIWPLA